MTHNGETPDLTATQIPLEEAPPRTEEPRTAGLEQALAGAQEALRVVEGERDSLLETARTHAARYREALLAAAPEVPPDLVTGDTLEAIDASLAAARRTVAVVQQRLNAAGSPARVPAGAPARSGPDLRSLSPKEKIAFGLSQDG